MIGPALRASRPPGARADGAPAFAAFLERLGHRVLRAAGGWWYNPFAAVLLAFPGHRPVAPEPSELRTILRAGRALALRYTAPEDHPGRPSYVLACARPDYDLGQLGGNARSKVRRGLRRCEVRAVSCAEIARLGRPLDEETVRRQGRRSRHAGARWDRFWEAAAQTPGLEGWAAFAGGEMAAYLVTMDFGDAVELMLARSRRSALGAYPNNALVYTVTREMLVERGVPLVTFGIESLEPVTALEEFKLGMGFQRVPLRQRVVFHPLLGWLLRLPAAAAVLARLGSGRGPGAERWRKLAGMARFAAEGQGGSRSCTAGMRR